MREGSIWTPTFKIGLGLILALALATRLWDLGASLWYDEVFTLVHFVRLPFGEIVSTFTSLNNHPLYSLLAKISTTLFGENAAAVRLPAALFGVGSIALTAILARRVLSEPVALLVCLLIALSYHHVWFSQNARGYTGLLFFALAGSYFFLRGAESGEKWPWLGYAASFAAAHYTHLSAALFFAGHGAVYAYFLIARRFLNAPAQPLSGPLPFFGMLGGCALTLALYAPMLGSMGGTFAAVRETPAVDSLASWKDPGFVLANLLDQISGLSPLMAIAAPGVLVCVITGAVLAWRKAPIFAAVFLLPIPITIVGLSIAGMRLWPRYFFIEIAFLYICLTLGAFALLTWILNWARAQQSSALKRAAPAFPYLPAVTGAVMIVGSVALLAKNYAYPKQDLAGAVAYVEAQAQPGDVRGAYGLAGESIQTYFAPDWRRPREPQALRALSEDGRAWVVVAFPAQLEAGDPEGWAVLQNAFALSQELPGTMGDGQVLVFVSRER